MDYINVINRIQQRTSAATDAAKAASDAAALNEIIEHLSNVARDAQDAQTAAAAANAIDRGALLQTIEGLRVREETLVGILNAFQGWVQGVQNDDGTVPKQVARKTASINLLLALDAGLKESCRRRCR